MDIAELRSYKPKLVEIAAKYGVSNIRVFGSIVRGEETKESDIDLLVDVDRSKTILDFVGFQMEASDALQQQVDLVSSQGIHQLLRDEIFNTAVSL